MELGRLNSSETENQLTASSHLRNAIVNHYTDIIRDRWVPTIRNGHKGVIDKEHLLIFKKVTSCYTAHTRQF